jgi:hypothetical protein
MFFTSIFRSPAIMCGRSSLRGGEVEEEALGAGSIRDNVLTRKIYFLNTRIVSEKGSWVGLGERRGQGQHSLCARYVDPYVREV